MDTSRFIERWHECIEARDVAGLTELLADNITFHSPAFFNPYKGRTMVGFLFMQIAETLPDLRYVNTFTDGSGGVVMQFEATVSHGGDELTVDGVDVIELDEDGRLADLKVMIRPLNGLTAVAKEMRRRFMKAMKK